jgi:AcrR family transcriptional regulator
MERKPGRPRALTVDLIAQAALDDGIATFSMPSIARRLGVAHSGLYRYVTDREDLLIAALERAAAEVEWPSPDLPWQDLLRAVGDTMWQMCEAHPGLDRAALGATSVARRTEAEIGTYVEALERQGFVTEDAAVSVDFVITLALSASAEMAKKQVIERRREEVPAARPDLKAYSTEEVWSGRGWYDRKLEIVLAGLAQRHLG